MKDPVALEVLAKKGLTLSELTAAAYEARSSSVEYHEARIADLERRRARLMADFERLQQKSKPRDIEAERHRRRRRGGLMATRAQIEANRRNARKSTGPRTAEGKATSSRNAVTHGLTVAANDQAVLTYYRAICEAGDEVNQRPEAAEKIAALAMRLARAEVQMAQVRNAAFEVLAQGDDHLRLLPERDGIIDRFLEDEVILEPLTLLDRIQGLKLLMRLAVSGDRYAKRTYAKQLRYLREAEARHETALSEWLDSISSTPETSQISR